MTIPNKGYFTRSEVIDLTGIPKDRLARTAKKMGVKPVLLPTYERKRMWPWSAVERILTAGGTVVRAV